MQRTFDAHYAKRLLSAHTLDMMYISLKESRTLSESIYVLHLRFNSVFS